MTTRNSRKGSIIFREFRSFFRDFRVLSSFPLSPGFWAILAFSTFLGLLYSGQYYLGLEAETKAPRWSMALWQVLVSNIWTVLAPTIFWLGRRFPLEKPVWPRHLVLHLGFATVLSLVRQGVYTAVTGWLEIYSDWEIRGFGPQFVHFIWMYFHTGLFAYFALLGVGMAFDYRRRYRERELQASQLRAQLSDAQLSALRMQLQPHFLFNTLNSIVGLIRDGRHKAAIDVTAGLSELLRHVLNQSNRHEVALGEELEFLERYLEIQQMRFSDRLRLKMEIDPASLSARVPSLILQPLVENAIQHGIAERAEPGSLTLSARRDNGQLHLEVYNDGPLLPEGWQLERDSGVGLTNTGARLQQLYGVDQCLVLRNRDGRGVSAAIIIPFKPSAPEPNGIGIESK